MFTFTSVQTGNQYTCSGSPNPAYYDVASWQRGQQVFFDSCAMQFPADAPPGDYQVSVGITDASGSYLPATDSSGSPIPNGQIVVGSVTLLAP